MHVMILKQTIRQMKCEEIHTKCNKTYQAVPVLHQPPSIAAAHGGRTRPLHDTATLQHPPWCTILVPASATPKPV